MAGRPRKCLLTEDERRTLQLLAFSPRGVTEDALVLAHGCNHDMLTCLLDAKLAKRYRVTVTAGGRTTGVSVTYMKITATGRKAIESE